MNMQKFEDALLKDENCDLYILDDFEERMLRYKYTNGKTECWLKHLGGQAVPIDRTDKYVIDTIYGGEFVTKEDWDRGSSLVATAVHEKNQEIMKAFEESDGKTLYMYNPRVDEAYRIVYPDEDGVKPSVWGKISKSYGGGEVRMYWDEEDVFDSWVFGFPLTKEEYDNFEKKKRV